MDKDVNNETDVNTPNEVETPQNGSSIKQSYDTIPLDSILFPKQNPTFGERIKQFLYP